MYPILLSLHGIFRWIVLATALWAVIRFVSGWLGKKSFTETDSKARKFYTIALDIQFTFGLILMFLSPFVAAMFDDFKGGMKNTEVRYFGLEHVLIMLIAVVLAHIGAGVSKKATDDATRFKKGAIFFVLSLAVMLYGIPWWRPLARMTME
ncbi:MAG: hypothetical protein H7X80_01650 [bacterium]|nr:hypothetical protein [Candidatus Kapabacteria bacterium]